MYWNPSVCRTATVLLINILAVNAMLSPQEPDNPADKSSVGDTATQAKLPARQVQEKYRHMMPAYLTDRSPPSYMLGDDDEPMVYDTPRDYATYVRQERDWLISMGADPESIVFQSELCKHVPRRQDDEADAEYAKRFSNKMNEMIKQGTLILNDVATMDGVASGHGVPKGRFFDLGPESGATKGEFKAFEKWWFEIYQSEEPVEVPERWLKFERAKMHEDEL